MAISTTIRIQAKSENNSGFLKAFAAINGRTAEMTGFFFQFTENDGAEFWLAYSGDKVVGSIGAHVLESEDRVGAVGFFQSQSIEIAEALFHAAESWLCAKGCVRAVGPIDINTWFPYRFRIDSHHETFDWEPISRPKEYNFFTAAGYTLDATFLSVASADLRKYVSQIELVYSNVIAADFRFRRFDLENLANREAHLLFTLSEQGFAENYLYEPMALEKVRTLYRSVAGKYDLSLSHFVLDQEDNEIGFLLAVIDQNYLVFKTITILPKYRATGLSTALTYLSAKAVLDRGLQVDKYITALVKDGNLSGSYNKKTEQLWTHQYVLLCKQL